MKEVCPSCKGTGEIEIIELREIPREQAKKEIIELFQKRDKLYYSEIAEELALDLELIVDICNELEKENLIAEE